MRLLSPLGRKFIFQECSIKDGKNKGVKVKIIGLSVEGLAVVQAIGKKKIKLVDGPPSQTSIIRLSRLEFKDAAMRLVYDLVGCINEDEI
jgi:hypothetical protein